MASMRDWLAGRALFTPEQNEGGNGKGQESDENETARKNDERVVVVHCKAGKGRSGTMACSYLIAEEGWSPEDALARFTERRMRPKFGSGVSIPSQLRWVSYVDRWANKGGKKYVDRPVEIEEIHVWGLRHGVKVTVEGFVEEGKKIQVFHTFKPEERIVVEGDAPGGGGMMDFVYDLAGYAAAKEDDKGEIMEDADYEEITKDKKDQNGTGLTGGKEDDTTGSDRDSDGPTRSDSPKKEGKSSRAGSILRMVSNRRAKSPMTLSKLGANGEAGSTTVRRSRTIAMPEPSKVSNLDESSDGAGVSKSASSTSLAQKSFAFADASEPGGQAVIFKPAKPILVPNSDVNISVERRNRTSTSMGLAMVTAVAHVWFNVFFEGQGPEREDGKADDSGVFEIDWDRMDGIKGSSQKGTRACDRISVVWRVAGTAGAGTTEPAVGKGVLSDKEGEATASKPVPQMKPADWEGEDGDDTEGGATTGQKRLGLKVESPSESVSDVEVGKTMNKVQAPRVIGDEGTATAKQVPQGEGIGVVEEDDESLKGVKISGPGGEEVLDETPISTVGNLVEKRN